jgi:membrane protein involved in colicin uptake
MADETKPEPKDTSAGEGKNTDGNGAGAGTQTAKATEAAKTFTQEEVERIAGEARRKERERAKQEADEAERKRQEDEAKKKGEFEALAKTFEGERDAAVKERDDYKTKYETLAERVKKSALAEVAALPEHIQKLAPTDDDLDRLLEWLPKGKEAAGVSAPPPGNSRGPKPTGGAGDGKVDEEARQGQRRIYQSL